MRKISIIGCAEGWQNAPFDQESWGVTNVILRRDVDQHFDIHDLTWNVQQWYDYYMVWIRGHFGRQYMLDKAKKRVEQMPFVFARINQLGIPSYSVRPYPDVPSSVAYPIKEVVEHFKCTHFGCTIDYVIAKAIYDEVDAIDLYGVRMSGRSEYAHQLRSAHHWIGIAQGRGIAVHVHGSSQLFRTHTGLMYGYNIPLNGG